MADAIWNARSQDHRRFFIGHVLGPLVAATRPADLRTPDAVQDAAAAWMLCLKDVPADVLERGVEQLLGAGPKWMPRPGDLREACAAEIEQRRKAAAAKGNALIANCPKCRGSRFAELFDTGGRSLGVARCDCHQRALQLLDGLPAPLALPPARAAEEREVSA